MRSLRCAKKAVIRHNPEIPESYVTGTPCCDKRRAKILAGFVWSSARLLWLQASAKAAFSGLNLAAQGRRNRVSGLVL